MARYAKQYAPELYSRKPILRLANPAPLCLDEHVQFSDLGATLLVENPEALIECFVVTSRGRYRGIVTGEALLRCKVALLQAREEELSRALDAANEASIALHQHLGFQPAGMIKEAGYKFGRWLDLVFYQKILSSPSHPTED